MQHRAVLILFLLSALAGCTREPAAPGTSTGSVQHVVLITIDTLRADHVGAYGARVPTPAIDALAANGVIFDRAYATAPITLTSHASLMTGRYPPGHGARHNGMRMDLKTPTLAEAFARAGYVTGAFVGAFPLDRRFGLIKGFQTYGDTMPRDTRGRPANERPGHMVVDEALAWATGHRSDRVFLWVHLFEPHAPYGNPGAQPQRSATDRYEEDVLEADRQVGRLLAGLGFDRATTLVVLAADHGEAFGEHGEVSHSLFAYDTTLWVPLIFSGAGFQGPQKVLAPVSLVDVAPTIASMAGLGAFDSDGVNLQLPAPNSQQIPTSQSPISSTRALYSETFAPLLDFGWSPLRTIRSGTWKYIAAPQPELYDLASDPGEERNVVAAQAGKAAELARLVDAIARPTLPANAEPEDKDARARLQALGYASGRGDGGGTRPDPKDRKELAAQIARVTSGELRGAALERALRDILRADPRNPQANVRLGYVLMESNRCREAMPLFRAAIDAQLPSADAHLGLAGCQIAAKNASAAQQTLLAAQQMEPGNPVVTANLGLILSDTGQSDAAIPHLQRALTLDPDLHQARFALALAFARTGRRTEAAAQASELLRRLPPGAPQRPEVERLLAAVR